MRICRYDDDRVGLVAHASAMYTLYPGDRIDASIEGIGAMSVTMYAA